MVYCFIFCGIVFLYCLTLLFPPPPTLVLFTRVIWTVSLGNLRYSENWIPVTGLMLSLWDCSTNKGTKLSTLICLVIISLSSSSTAKPPPFISSHCFFISLHPRFSNFISYTRWWKISTEIVSCVGSRLPVWMFNDWDFLFFLTV